MLLDPKKIHNSIKGLRSKLARMQVMRCEAFESVDVIALDILENCHHVLVNRQDEKNQR